MITHPYFVDSVPGLKKAQSLMERLADLVSQYSEGEYDRLRFGIVISGVTYTLVSANILELQSVPEEELREMLTSAVSSMVMGAPATTEVAP